MKRSGSVAMNDNKKFKPADAPVASQLSNPPVKVQSLPHQPPTLSQVLLRPGEFPPPPPPDVRSDQRVGIDVGAVSKPADVYDAQFNDLWSPD